MRLALLAVLPLLVIFTPINAEEISVIGPGKNSCSEFIAVVDGNWSHPLNALHFHGYIAWAQGMISGYNQAVDKEPVTPNADELKTGLVDFCRDQPDAMFANAVGLFIKK